MPPLLLDVFANVVAESAYASATLTNGTEGTLVDVSGYNGIIMARLRLVEAASVPVDDKLDITVHNVASDSDTLDSDNLCGTFDQIVGLNGSELAHELDIPINLNLLPILTTAEKATQKAAGINTVKKYLQILIGNTHAWGSSPLIIDFYCAGARSLPANALP